MDMHRVLEEEKAILQMYEESEDAKQLKLNEDFGYLMGIDTCSYRLPCKIVKAGREKSINDKRYKQKLAMLDV